MKSVSQEEKKTKREKETHHLQTKPHPMFSIISTPGVHQTSVCLFSLTSKATEQAALCLQWRQALKKGFRLHYHSWICWVPCQWSVRAPLSCLGEIWIKKKKKKWRERERDNVLWKRKSFEITGHRKMPSPHTLVFPHLKTSGWCWKSSCQLPHLRSWATSLRRRCSFCCLPRITWGCKPFKNFKLV